MQTKYYIDRNGRPRVHVPASKEALRGWLEQDIQGNPESIDAECNEIFAIIRDVRSGQISGWEGTGNAHALTITPRGARIETEFAEPPAVADLSLDELEESLSKWRMLILNNRKSKPSNKEADSGWWRSFTNKLR